MIVPAGALSEDQMEWMPSGDKFFLPIKVLSAIFRGILCKLLHQAVKHEELLLPDGIKDFQPLKTQCYQKKWVVYCEKPFKSPDNLVNYLGNYIHRVAISNQRIIGHKDGKVSFWYKDYSSNGRQRKITLVATEFIRRFMQHVLPTGFYKIRYFGFLAMCNSKTKLEKCFELIEKDSWLAVLEGLNATEVWEKVAGKDLFCCPVCRKGRMITVSSIVQEHYNTG
jgi:hypothetical protein